MGKQRIPQGQRPGRRPPVRRATGGIAPAAAMPTEAVAEVGADPEPTAPDQDVAPVGAEIEAETPEAAIAATESASVETTDSDAGDAPTAEVAAVPEPEAVAAPEAPEEPAAAQARDETVAEATGQAAPDEVPAAEAAPTEPLLPVVAPTASKSSADASRPRPERPAFRFTFVPARLDVEGIGVVLANYMHNESVAALSHMRALSTARSPAEMIRLNVTEMQRAADASLTCWSDIARRAARSVPLQ